MASNKEIEAAPEANVISGSHQTAVTQGLIWENINLSVTTGRGKKAVKRQLLSVCNLHITIVHY